MSELFQHAVHPHEPANANHLHSAEQSFNTRLAVALTKIVGTMPTAYTFACLALLGLLGILGILSPLAIVLVTWISQTFLQLVFLPILSVGQSVLSRKQEIQADETYGFTVKSYHDVEQIRQHLYAQDQELVRQTHIIEEQGRLIEQFGVAVEKLIKRVDMATGRNVA